MQVAHAKHANAGILAPEANRATRQASRTVVVPKVGHHIATKSGPATRFLVLRLELC